MQQGTISAVFDTANGFCAVWHLDSCGLDATDNHYSGIPVGNVAMAQGVLGGAQRFHGSDYIAINGLLGENPSLTLSAWVLLDTPDVTGGEVISVGDAALIRTDDTWNGKGTHGAYFCNPTAPDTSTHEYLGSGLFFEKTGWHFLVYQYDSGSGEHRFFIDGELCCLKAVSVPIQYEYAGTLTMIGTHGNGKPGRFFNGIIDEVRVSSVCRSASWIKLCFLTQKKENSLLYCR